MDYWALEEVIWAGFNCSISAAVEWVEKTWVGKMCGKKKFRKTFLVKISNGQTNLVNCHV